MLHPKMTVRDVEQLANNPAEPGAQRGGQSIVDYICW